MVRNTPPFSNHRSGSCTVSTSTIRYPVTKQSGYVHEPAADKTTHTNHLGPTEASRPWMADLTFPISPPPGTSCLPTNRQPQLGSLCKRRQRRLPPNPRPRSVAYRARIPGPSILSPPRGGERGCFTRNAGATRVPRYCGECQAPGRRANPEVEPVAKPVATPNGDGHPRWVSNPRARPTVRFPDFAHRSIAAPPANRAIRTPATARGGEFRRLRRTG